MAVKTDDKPADEEKKEGDKADGDKAAAAGDKKQQRRGQGPHSIETFFDFNFGFKNSLWLEMLYTTKVEND